jgi:hypothetical protein
MKQTSTSKHQQHRRRTRLRALDLLGNKCQCCGFDDERALRFHHTKPLQRTRNGIRKRDQTSTETHRAILNGKGRGIRLLCANCSVIAQDASMNVNITRTTKPPRAVKR